MASCSVENTKNTLLSNIESFMNDSAYRDIIESSATYNTRLCIERRLRMPFLDAQTGVAQNHSNLFMSSRQRMPGLLPGQVYTYPAKRWRKKRRQYLINYLNPKRRDNDNECGDLHPISTIDSVLCVNEDSKNSTGSNSLKDESASKDSWYYEELEMQDMEVFDEPDPDSDYDYEDSYTKKRKKRASGKPPKSFADSPLKRGLKTMGRGRRKGLNYAPDYSDTDKPYYCDLCGARYKTRPGLTYHYTHSHKDKIGQDDDTSLDGAPSSPSVTKDKPTTSGHYTQPAETSTMMGSGSGKSTPASSIPAPPAVDVSNASTWGKFQDSTYMPFTNTGNSSTKKLAKNGTQPQPSTSAQAVSATPTTSSAIPPDEDSSSNSDSDKKDDASKESSPVSVSKQDDKDKANPSPYCDFCLGNEESNKKSGQPEELVSCSDCGRSGHPTCLQFTSNMIISVRKYRWQCIECKCCSICGTSDNDDQLLFCDDCDRGYHMYCLDPPLDSPPEGSWSCKLCVEEFHS